MIRYEVVIPRSSKGRAETLMRRLKGMGFDAEVRAIDDYGDIFYPTVFEAMNEYRRRTGASFVQAADWVRAHPESHGGADGTDA